MRWPRVWNIRPNAWSRAPNWHDPCFTFHASLQSLAQRAGPHCPAKPKETDTITGTLTGCERMPSSGAGNPRYRVSIGGEIFVTAPDSPLGYRVTNYRGNAVTATWRILRGNATLQSIEKVSA